MHHAANRPLPNKYISIPRVSTLCLPAPICQTNAEVHHQEFIHASPFYWLDGKGLEESASERLRGGCSSEPLHSPSHTQVAILPTLAFAPRSDRSSQGPRVHHASLPLHTHTHKHKGPTCSMNYIPSLFVRNAAGTIAEQVHIRTGV